MKARLNPGSKFVKAGVSVLALSWLAAVHLNAAEITGKVRDASGDTATVVTDQTWLAAIGDSVEIFFKLPGADEEISVATGTVTAVDAKLAKIKVVNATGTIEKDQLARIKPGPGSPQKAPAKSGSSSATESGKSATSSIQGDWIGTGGDGNLSFSFKDDGTFLWIIKSKDVTETMRGKYRLDAISRPHRIDLFEISPPEERGDALSGIFELQGDGRLKLDLSVGHREKTGQGFTDGAVVFSKATSPIVAPPEKKPADTSPKPKAPGASPSGTAATGSSIIGDWVGNLPDGPMMSFSFKEDGTLLWLIEDAQYARSMLAKYRIDPSTQPQSIELFDIEEDAFKGQRHRGIFEVQGDGRLKLDLGKGSEAPPLKEFTEDTLVLSRATSPVVRSNKPAAPTPTPSVASTPSPTPPDAQLVGEGDKLYERKDYDGAIEAYTKAIELNPKNARAYHYRGTCFVMKGDKDAAIADYEKAIELKPSYSETLDSLVISLRAGRAEERDRKKASASPPQATPTATPARSRKKAKP